MLLRYLTLSFFIFSLCNSQAIKSMEINNKNIDTNNIFTIETTPFHSAKLFVQVMAHCDFKTRNRLSYANKYLYTCEAQDNNMINLISSHLVLSSEDQIAYVTRCIHKDNIAMLKQLLANGADPNKTDEKNRTPLFLAIIKNSINCAKFLIEETTIDINESNEDYPAPLCYAAHENRIEIVQSLLAHKNIVHTKTFDTCPPCNIAAERGHIEIVKILLAHDPTVLNMGCCFGSTPLYVSVHEEHTHIVEFLLTFKDIEVNSLHNDYTPLYIASEYGHTTIVKALLKHPDIIVTYINPNGFTPLSVASYYGNAKVVKLFLAHPDIHINDTKMSLFIAVRKGHAPIVRLLINYNPDLVNIYLEDNSTPLHLACRKNNIDVIRALLESQYINMYETNCKGETPLEIAFDMDNPKTIKDLKQIAALFTQRNSKYKLTWEQKSLLNGSATRWRWIGNNQHEEIL